MGENNKLKVRHVSAKETATEDNRNALANEVVIGRNGHYLLFDNTSKAIKNLTKHWFIPDGTYAHDSKYVLQWDNTNKKFSLVAESTGGGGGSNSLPVPANPGNWYLVSSGSGDSMTFAWAPVTDNNTTYNAGAGIALNADKFSVDIANNAGLTFSAFDNNNVPTDSSKLKLVTMTTSNLGGAKLSVIRNNNVAWTTLNISGSHDGNNYNQLEIGTNSSSQLYASIPKQYVIPQIPTNSEEKLYLLKVNGSTKSWQEYTAPSAGQTYGLMTTSADGLGRLGINGVTTLPTTGWESISSGKIYPVSRTSTGSLGVRMPSFAERPKVYRYDNMLHDSNNHVTDLNIRSGLSDYSRTIEDCIVADKKKNIVLQVPDLIMNELYKVEIDFDATCLNSDPGHNIIFELTALSNSSPVFNSLLSTPKMQTETNYMYRFSITFVFQSAEQFLDLIFTSRCGNPIDTLLIDTSSISVVLTKVD